MVAEWEDAPARFANLLRSHMLGPALFWARIGRVEVEQEINAGDSSYGMVMIRTTRGTRLQVTKNRVRWPKPRLQRCPGPGPAPSLFDAPGMVMTRGFQAKVGEPARFEDTSGAFGGGSRWTTSQVQAIEVRRTHGATCDRGLLRGRCLSPH